MLEVIAFVVTVSWGFSCVLATQLRFGLLQSSSNPVSESAISRIVSEWNNPYVTNRTCDIAVDVLRVSHPDSFTASQLVRTLACNGTVAFFSTDDCSLPLTESFGAAGQPLVRVSSGIECDLPRRMGNGVFTLPSAIEFRIIVKRIFEDLQWKSANVFYDQSYDYSVRHVLATLRQLRTTIRLDMITDGLSESDVGSLVNAALRSNTVLQMTNNIVLCSFNNTMHILKQARWWEEFTGEERPGIYRAHWLIFTADDDVVTRIEQDMFNLDNLAIVHIKLDTLGLSVDKRFEDGLLLVLHSINDFLRETNASSLDHVFVKNAEGCDVINNEILLEHIMPRVENSSHYNTCSPYRIYSVSRQSDIRVLEDEGFCGDDGKTIRNVDMFPNGKYGLHGQHLRVATFESSPYVSTVTEYGDVRFYGICIDMLDLLSTMLNFTYTLTTSLDGVSAGANTGNNSWNGVVGMLQRKEVDMAVASLSVSAERSVVIDFVPYFTEFGGILIRELEADKLQVLVEPFKLSVWVCIVCSVPLAAVFTWALSRLVAAFKTNSNDEFTCLNTAAWYTFGSIFYKGGTSQPRALPVRAFIGCWWAFCIVIVTTYGGSLIAFLTISKSVSPFCTLEEMVQQSTYRWGTHNGSVYANAFSRAKQGVYSEVWAGIQRFIVDDPDVLLRDKHVQFEKVKQGGYAYIMDSTPLTMHALIDSNCTVVVLKCHFLELPFGIGLQKGSPFKNLLSKSIQRIQQAGLLTMWKNKWWPTGACRGIDVPESHAVDLPDTQSAFYLLFGGVLVACIALAAERCRSSNFLGLLWKSRTTS